MPYRKANDFKSLPLLPLSDASIRTLDVADDLHETVEVAGITALLDIAPAESFERLAHGRISLPTDERDIEHDFAATANNQPTMAHIRDAEKAGVSPQTTKDVDDFLFSVSDVVLHRIRHAFEASGEAEKKAFQKTASVELNHALTNREGDFDSPDREGRQCLETLNQLMDKISANPDVSDKLQRICEAAYTLATAEAPLTLDEAKMRVSKTTLAAPKRGGIGGHGV